MGWEKHCLLVQLCNQQSAFSGPENPRTGCVYKDKETARVGLAKTFLLRKGGEIEKKGKKGDG